MEEKKNKEKNEEAFKCEDCLNYEWYDEEIGYQCIYQFQPPCDDPMWSTNN